MSLNEANSNFTVDASNTPPSNNYMMVGENVYGYSYSGTNIAANSFGDIDTYGVHLDIGSKYIIQASGSNIFGTPVTKANFALLDRNGKVLSLSYDYITTSKLSFTAGDSFFYIQEYSDSSGMYLLSIDNLSISETNSKGEYTNGISEFISYGKTYSAALEYTSDIDTYTAYLEAGKTYYFSLLSTIPDIFLEVEYNQNRVAALVANGQGLYYFTAGYNGYYDLNISSNNFINTGKYTLITQPTLTNNSPTGTVTITGTPTENQILTASNNLADADGLGAISYTWLRDGTAINAATQTTYTLTLADVGKKLSVKASYTDLLGTAESVSSTATTTVANVNTAPTGPVTTVVTVNKTGLDFTAPFSTTTSYIQNTTSGYAVLSAYTEQWTGNNLKYTTGYLMPTSGTITGIEISTPKPELIYALTCNYEIQATDTNFNSNALFFTIAVKDNVQWYGGINDDKFIFYANNQNVDGGAGNDSFYSSHDFSAYKFSNLNIAKSSVTLTNIALNVSANLTSIENFVFTDKTISFSQITIPNTAPTGTVTIMGTPTQNQVLTATNNLIDADGLGTISYTWLLDGIAINAATQSTYTLTQADVGKKITVSASYTDLLGTAESVSSSATTAVANVNDAPTGTVSITGTATKNQILTASNNLADADGLGTIGYTWLRDGTAINASTQSTYTLTQADVGKKLSVKASYTDLLGTAESVSSAATTAVANVNDVPTGNVNITGVAAINQTLTANNNLADADGLGAISYTWLRDGIAINTATQSTYTLTQADVGKKLSVKASYTDLLGALENVVSSSVIPVGLLNHLPTGSVTISGTAFKGQVLTASNNLVDTDGLGAISYTWLDNGVVIPNATQSTYKLTQAETGQNISVKASYTDALGTAESAFSSNLVINKNILSTGAATVKGLPTWGTTLSITSTIKDADGIGKLSYIWQNDKTTLSTSATYTLADSDIGKQVWAVVSYTDKKGSLEEVKSNIVNVTVSDKASAVNDVLTGTDGANKLNGLAGNDTLIGGLGKDSLTGGVGADVFKFNSINDSSALPKQADTITDFKHAQSDKIDLSAIDANSVLPNDQAFTLISAATFSADATGQLRFDAKTSTLYGSTNADAVPEFAIVLSGVKTLVAEDLIL